MIKRITILLVLLSSNLTYGQAIEKGKIIIEPYYGFPNVYGLVFKALYNQSNDLTNYTFRSAGPLGLRTELLVTDKFGIGIEVGYSAATVSYDNITTDGNGNNVTYNYRFRTNRLIFAPTFNFHFLEEDNMDLSLFVGAGYGRRTFAFESNEPNFINPSTSSVIPVSFRLGLVYRYFFTQNIGVCLSVGTPLLGAGLTLKF